MGGSRRGKSTEADAVFRDKGGAVYAIAIIGGGVILYQAICQALSFPGDGGTVIADI